jgi:hypothetical protein
MDDLEGKHDVKADQRVDQFLRLRDAVMVRQLDNCRILLQVFEFTGGLDAEIAAKCPNF